MRSYIQKSGFMSQIFQQGDFYLEWNKNGGYIFGSYNGG